MSRIPSHRDVTAAVTRCNRRGYNDRWDNYNACQAGPARSDDLMLPEHARYQLRYSLMERRRVWGIYVHIFRTRRRIAFHAWWMRSTVYHSMRDILTALVCSLTVTIRAHRVAFGNLSHDVRTRPPAHIGERRFLLTTHMVKVHDVRSVLNTAVRARTRLGGVRHADVPYGSCCDITCPVCPCDTLFGRHTARFDTVAELPTLGTAAHDTSPVRVVGHDPTTSCSQGTRASQLRHTLITLSRSLPMAVHANDLALRNLFTKHVRPAG